MCQLNTQHTISSVVVFCFDYLIVCLLACFDEKIVAIVLIFYWSLGFNVSCIQKTKQNNYKYEMR